MKLYVCWVRFSVLATKVGVVASGRVPVQEGARRADGRRSLPEVVKAYGFAALPDITRARREVKRLTGQCFVPVLVLDDGQVIGDSKNIVACPAAPSHTSELGAWPVVWRHGWK